ncbi:YbhB/YbcL family Raf kinase inhibitor-like protein [uncultured Sphingomonas sp.]|uniref:YbhB/YbcL family Raf kinase inhibitor-like protein n=1 Tax=uncultured Sphingomonas sp. TaxID=158754 RepID=UPI0035C9892C
MHRWKPLAAMLPPLSAAAATLAQAPTAPPPGPIAMDRVETRGDGRLTVVSPAFAAGGPIPRRYTKYDDNVSPPLAWRGAPARTQAYALIVDDPDGRIKPVTHWLVWNIATPGLPEGVAIGPETPPPVAARQGTTTMRVVGFSGPHPPIGDLPHHYHFQVFALDTTLSAPAGADREAVLAQMKGHVLARGELVGVFGQTAPPTP